MKRITIKLLAFCLGLFLIGNVAAQETQESDKVNFKFGGFAKTDYMFTQYNNGAYSGAGRDFHIPGTIPVGDKDIYRYTDFHVKESRFNFDVSTTVNGKKLRTFIELDFMLSPGGNEIVSNSYNPRVRHFFIEYDKLLFGQTWSTFMIVILPDELDFLGTPEGLVFVRQPMARLTLGGFQLALENPISTIANNNPAPGNSTRFSTQSGLLPDLIARYNFDFGSSNLSVAAIGRHLHYIDDTDTKQSGIGLGASVGGKFKVGSKDDIRFVGTLGSGLGRYAGINFITSSVIDTDNSLKSIFSINGYIAYLHHWSSKLRTSVSASAFIADNDEAITGPSVNDKAFSVSANLLYAPAKKLIFGIEPRIGYRELVDGTNGSFLRLQASAKYAFSFKTSASK